MDRIRDTGYIPSPTDGYVIGENLAWGTYQLSTPQAIVAAWIASPGHLANILEAQYQRNRESAITPAVPASLAPTAHPAPPTRRSSASSSLSARRWLDGAPTPACHLRSLLWPDQRKEVVQTLSDSSCGTLEVTGR